MEKESMEGWKPIHLRLAPNAEDWVRGKNRKRGDMSKAVNALIQNEIAKEQGTKKTEP